MPNAEESNNPLERYLSLIGATSHIPASSERASFADAIIDRLTAFAEAAAKPEDHPKDMASLPPSFIHSLPTKRPWLEAIIYVISINKALFFDGIGSADTQKRIIDVLCTLMREPKLQACLDVVEYIFDVIASFSDDMPPELRNYFSEAYASNSSSDARLSFLFGSTMPPDAWLALGHPSSTLPQTTAATPGSMGPPPQQMPSRLHQSQSMKNQEMKTTPFVLNRWELLQAPPPMGENDTSLSLSLFGAREK